MGASAVVGQAETPSVGTLTIGSVDGAQKHHENEYIAFTFAKSTGKGGFKPGP